MDGRSEGQTDRMTNGRMVRKTNVNETDRQRN